MKGEWSFILEIVDLGDGSVSSGFLALMIWYDMMVHSICIWLMYGLQFCPFWWKWWLFGRKRCAPTVLIGLHLPLRIGIIILLHSNSLRHKRSSCSTFFIHIRACTKVYGSYSFVGSSLTHFHLIHCLHSNLISETSHFGNELSLIPYTCFTSSFYSPIFTQLLFYTLILSSFSFLGFVNSSLRQKIQVYCNKELYTIIIVHYTFGMIVWYSLSLCACVC